MNTKSRKQIIYLNNIKSELYSIFNIIHSNKLPFADLVSKINLIKGRDGYNLTRYNKGYIDGMIDIMYQEMYHKTIYCFPFEGVFYTNFNDLPENGKILYRQKMGVVVYKNTFEFFSGEYETYQEGRVVPFDRSYLIL